MWRSRGGVGQHNRRARQVRRCAPTRRFRLPPTHCLGFCSICLAASACGAAYHGAHDSADAPPRRRDVSGGLISRRISRRDSISGGLRPGHPHFLTHPSAPVPLSLPAHLNGGGLGPAAARAPNAAAADPAARGQGRRA